MTHEHDQWGIKKDRVVKWRETLETCFNIQIYISGRHIFCKMWKCLVLQLLSRKLENNSSDEMLNSSYLNIFIIELLFSLFI